MHRFAYTAWSKFIAGFVASVTLLWLLSAAALYGVMRQTPERFGFIMSHVPTAAMIVLPFRPLWMAARSGRLEVGDAAPDFQLPLLHSDRVVTLSEELRQQPVVLIFGSYT